MLSRSFEPSGGGKQLVIVAETLTRALDAKVKGDFKHTRCCGGRPGQSDKELHVVEAGLKGLEIRLDAGGERFLVTNGAEGPGHFGSDWHVGGGGDLLHVGQKFDDGRRLGSFGGTGRGGQRGRQLTRCQPEPSGPGGRAAGGGGEDADLRDVGLDAHDLNRGEEGEGARCEGMLAEGIGDASVIFMNDAGNIGAGEDEGAGGRNTC